MTFRAFIYRSIIANVQKYSLFLLSTIFSMSVFFVFTNLWYTDGFKENTNVQMHDLMYIAAVITLIFSVFIISYVHWYMMKDRSKSFSVLLSYGMTYKDLRVLITGETLFIYVVSLLFAYITGSVFSKLFFMISTKLLMIDSLKYQLTFESFAATALVFIVIFISVLLISMIRLSHSDIITLTKIKNNPEMSDKSKTYMGLMGIFLIMSSLTALYFHNDNSASNISEWILGAALFCLIGVFIAIKHFSSLIYLRLKSNEKRYFAHILESAEFAMGYRQNVKTLFVLTLLTIGIILFSSITYTLNNQAYDMTEAENPHDFYFEDFAVQKIFNKQEANDFIAQQGTENFTGRMLPFLYMEAPDMIINNWRNSNWVAVVSESAYYQCFDSNIGVDSGNSVQIIFESTMDHKITYFKNNDLLLKNSVGSYTLNNVETIYDKILNRYVFTQGLLLIIDDSDYARFEKEATDFEKGSLHMYMFDNWKKSKDVCEAFSSEFYKRVEITAKQNMDIYNELIQRYGYAHLTVRAKIQYFNYTKLQGSFSLFIMSFVSILFAFCIMITYYFKVFMEASKDMERFRKLDGIGFLKKEKEALIKTRIRLIMFVPTALGIIIGVGWCFALNFNKLIEVELSNVIILRNAVLFSGLFFLFIITEYLILTKSYLRRARL